MTIGIFSKLKDEKGQNLVELALILVLLLALFFGIIEFGRVWYRLNLLKGAANAVARTYAVTQDEDEAKQTGVNVTGGLVAFQNISIATTSTTITATAREYFRFVVCPTPPPPIPLGPGQSLCTILIWRNATYNLER